MAMTNQLSHFPEKFKLPAQSHHVPWKCWIPLLFMQKWGSVLVNSWLNYFIELCKLCNVISKCMRFTRNWHRFFGQSHCTTNVEFVEIKISCWCLCQKQIAQTDCIIYLVIPGDLYIATPLVVQSGSLLALHKETTAYFQLSFSLLKNFPTLRRKSVFLLSFYFSLIHSIVTRVIKLANSQSHTALAPALVETYSRLLVYMEIELLGIKGFISEWNKNLLYWLIICIWIEKHDPESLWGTSAFKLDSNFLSVTSRNRAITNRWFSTKLDAGSGHQI